MQGRRKLSLGWLLSLMAALAAGPARGQEPVPVSAMDPAQLFAEARPHLEAVLGVRLERVPQFRVVRVEELYQLPDPGLETAIRWQFPDLQGKSLAGAVNLARHDLALATAASPWEGTDTVLVLPANLPRMASWDRSLAPVDSPAFLQLALVRATTRVLLDRRYHLAALRAGCHDGDAGQALQAVIEGRALQVTQQVAERLGRTATFPLLAEGYLHVPDLAPDPGVRAVSRQVLQRRHAACVQGLAFFNYLQEQGVANAERLVFTAPPRQLTWMARPELYLRSRQANRRELTAGLANLESSLPATQWQAVQQPWSPAMVRQVAALLGARERADRVLRAWDEGRSLVWTSKRNPAQQIALSVVRLENRSGARAYFGFAVELQRQRDTLLGSACTSSLRVLESHSSAVTLRHAEEAVRSDKRLQFAAASAALPVTTLLARAGDLVIECTWHGLPADLPWAQQLLDAYFRGR